MVPPRVCPSRSRIAVAPVLATLGAFAVRRADQPLHVQLHQPLRQSADHLPQQIAVGPLFKQLRQCHHFDGHRFPLWLVEAS